MFVWTKLPQQFSHLSSFEFCKKMIEETGVAMSPGSSFGQSGEGFVRFSLIHGEENMRRAVGELKKVF
jgi:alanine-synthesizing transaminase